MASRDAEQIGVHLGRQPPAATQNGTLRDAAVAASQGQNAESQNARDQAAPGTSSATADTSSPAGVAGAQVEASRSAADHAVDDVRDVTALQLPFGWDFSSEDDDNPRAFPQAPWDWALKSFGWLVSVLALSLGAPFWFDLLGRVVNVRDTGPRPGST